ncbi:hypothetical protein PWR05_15705 [Paraburkholderia sp. A2RI-6]
MEELISGRWKKGGCRLGQQSRSYARASHRSLATVYGMETGLFTGRKLSDYVSDEKQDYYNARKIINGHDQAETIADFAVRFKKYSSQRNAEKLGSYIDDGRHVRVGFGRNTCR